MRLRIIFKDEMPIRFAGALLLGSLLQAAPCVAQRVTPEADSVAVERTAYLMGTLLDVRLRAESAAAGHAAADVVFDEVARLEDVLSSWRSDSEVGRINEAPAGAPVPLSRELTVLLAEAGRWTERTAGAFDPGVGALIDGWGLRTEGRSPSGEELAAARAASGWLRAGFDSAAGRITRPSASWWLDTGGFGKGVALRAAASVLRRQGIARATLDFGGQLLQLNAQGAAALVAVADPAERERAAAWLRVADGSVATSAASERSVEIDGVQLGHIIDPRSGVPVPAWGSVTVVTRDPVVADVLSTALFVMGADAALDWAAGQRDVGVLILQRTGDGALSADWNEAMEQWLEDAPARDRRAGATQRDRS